MPANPKYLTQSGWQRFAKVSASVLGSFLISVSLHFAIAAWTIDRHNIWSVYAFSLFLIWCMFMLLAFLFKNGWKCWIWYGGAIVLFVLIWYAGSISNQ